MKSFLVVLAILISAFSSTAYPETPTGNAAPTISFSGGDGSSAEAAIVIDGARGESDGVDAEYIWFGNNLPGAKQLSQGLIISTDHAYDRIEVELPDGTKREVFFDISDFYGKM